MHGHTEGGACMAKHSSWVAVIPAPSISLVESSAGRAAHGEQMRAQVAQSRLRLKGLRQRPRRRDQQRVMQPADFDRLGARPLDPMTRTSCSPAASASSSMSSAS